MYLNIFLFVSVFFFGVHRSNQEHELELSRADYLSHFSIWRSSKMCFSSQHGSTDADSLCNRHLEFARAGAVNHGEEDH